MEKSPPPPYSAGQQPGFNMPPPQGYPPPPQGYGPPPPQGYAQPGIIQKNILLQ